MEPNDFYPASPGSRPPSVASSYGSITSGVSYPPRAGNKRKKRVDITWNDFDGFDQDGDESKSRKRTRAEEPDAKRLACPFYQHNPQGLQESPECAGAGWPSVHEVKEHILRRHKYSEFQCRRCYDEFATETALHDHQRADTPCEKNPVSNKIGIQQEKQLISLDPQHLNEEDRWNEMYKIVFPNAKVIPSPYYWPPKLPDYYQNLLMDRLPTLVRQEVSNSMFEEPLHPKILQRVETAVTTALKECLHEAYKKENRKQMESPSALPFQLEPWPAFGTFPISIWPEDGTLSSFESPAYGALSLPSLEWPEDGAPFSFEYPTF